MKKSVFKWIPVLAIAVSGAVFTSCGDDDVEVVAVTPQQPSSQNEESSESEPSSVTPVAVDLGLPSGTKWANMNIGASSESDAGKYFAWGEIKGYRPASEYFGPKHKYWWSDYKWCRGSGSGASGMTKYCSNSTYGDVDNKIALELIDDAARANWGGSWRMPTYVEFVELLQNTTQTVDYYNYTMMGVRLTSKINGKSIYLPYSGNYSSTSSSYSDYSSKGEKSCYWSSTVYNSLTNAAYVIEFDKSAYAEVKTAYKYRCYGMAIRPVTNASDVTPPETETLCPDDNHPHQIDLGLPSGRKWACCNVGAKKPHAYGLYYAWGETAGSYEKVFSPENYKWCDGTSYYMTKYCTNSQWGAVDNKTVLEAADDAATVNMGSGWRMPTSAELQELIDNTTKEWTELNGIKGLKFTANSNSIFLPAAGVFSHSFLCGQGNECSYSTSSLVTTDSRNSYRLFAMPSTEASVNAYGSRYHGETIRAVAK